MGRRIHILVLCLLITSGVSRGDSLVSSYDIYFGHLHNHTSFSDGTGTPSAAYSTAKAAGLDFLGLSDHSDSLTAAEYQSTIDAASAYNEDPTFTAFWGFEWSHTTYGHVTVVNCPTYCTTGGQPTFDALLTWLSSNQGVAFCNHPGRQDTAGTEFDHFTGWPSGAIVGMELWNKTNGFTTYYYNSGYTSDSRDRSGYFDDALFEGWRIGAAGSEDNHSGTCGSGSYRLAILAGANSRASLYAALQERRFYSTLDKNLELSFQVNGYQMGSSTAGGLSQCVVKAADRDAGEGFSKIEIIKNGYVVYTEDVAGATLPTVTCELSTQKGDYLYCKVTESDGGEAISSPVFITSNGPDGPPRADLAVPLDNGPADLQPADDQVTVNTTQPNFQIQLTDFEGIADGTVTSSTVSIAGMVSGTDYTFAYDAGTDIITLTPTSAVFGNGTYTITVSGISDIIGNTMAGTVLTVLIDTSIVAPQTLHFQQGLNGYAGTADTMVCAGAADTSFGGTSSLNVDNYDLYGGVSQILLRFGSIVGDAADQIPPGASISSATLRLNSLDTGNGGNLHAMLQPWSDTDTWNSLINGVTADDVEALSVADASTGATSIGDVDLNVTGTVQSWVNETLENNGWVVLPNGTDGSHIASAEYGTADYRPELIVTFVPGGGGDLPPVASAGPDQTVSDDDRDGMALVTLNGSASYPAASIVSYVWTCDGLQVANTQLPVAPDVPFLAPGVYNVTLTVTDSIGLSDTDEVVITVKVPSLFSEDFESGGFSAGGWVAGGQATVETTSARSGTYGVLLKKTSYVQTTINTGGAATATFTYWARTGGLNNEYLYIEWSQGGGTWQELNRLTGATGWAQFSHQMPLTQPSFAIRFRTNGNAGNDMAMIDDIMITGAAGGGNTAPSATDDIATTNQDSPVTINVLANDFDVDGDALTVAIATAPTHGSAAVNADNTVTHTPAAGYSGTDSFTYTISDGRGGTDTATVTVTITAPAGSLAITGVTPDHGTWGTIVHVTITGTGFVDGLTVALENGLGRAPGVSHLTVVSGTQIEADITPKVSGSSKVTERLWDVRVTNPDGSTAVKTGGFTVTTY